MLNKRYEWGDVEGDVNADAILSDRKAGDAVFAWVARASGILLVACAVWHGLSPSSWSLSCLIVSAAWSVGAAVERFTGSLKTWIMIVERRAQVGEQYAMELREDIWREGAKVRAHMDERSPGARQDIRH